MTDETTTMTAPPAPTIPSPVQPHTKAGLSDTESAMMVEWTKQDLAKGKLTSDQADKILTELNVPQEQRGPDTRSDDAKELDQHFPAAKPEDYRIAYAAPGEDVVMTQELKTFDASARGWLVGAGFPRDTGNSLVSAIAKVAQTTKGMDANQLEQYGYRQFEALQRVHGDKLEARLAAAAAMMHALDQRQPGLKNLLKSKGIGDNALIANMLIAHAAIYHARRR